MIKKHRKIFFIFLVLGIILTVFVIDAGAPPVNARPRISNIEVGDITNTSAKITFTVDQEDAKTMIDYGTSISLGQNSDWNNDTGLTRNITLSGLDKDTNYRLRIYAYNGNDPSSFSRSAIKSFKTTGAVTSTPTSTQTPNATAPTPNATAPTITDIKVEGITSSTTNISFSVSQSDARTRIKYGTTMSLGGWSDWNNGLSLQRKIMLSGLLNNTKYYYSIYAYNNSDNSQVSNSAIDSFTTEVYVTPETKETYGTGNRIWDESKDMNTNYIWSSFSFAGFYYDIDTNLSTEELVIKNIKRTISKGDIAYTTSPIEVDFGYSNFGKYQVIGFMADKYFAGYTGNSAVSSNKEISIIGRGQLQKVLIDDDDKRTVYAGSTLTLKEGYVLKMKEVDIGAGKGQIWISLLKDGGEIDSDIVEAGDNYIYTKRVGSIDLPMIAIHFDTIFRGAETNAAFIKGVFQVSDSYTSINNNNRYGKMEISEINKNRISMQNRETVSLSAGNKIDLMGDLKIIVADSDTLRFALSVERIGTFEARGTIYPITRQWTPMNFGLNIGNKNVGFYYNLDEDIGTESFDIESISGSSIPTGKLVYSTSPQEVSFEYSNFGKYHVIGFMADKYFAGYTDNTKPPNPSTSIGTKSTITQGQLHKILIDDEEKRTISIGSTLTLKDGYVLKATDIDMGARTMLLVLLKDGSEVDSTPLSAGQTYVYTKKVGSVDNLPIIIVRFDSVFSGTEMQAAFIKGVFQISESTTSVKVGDNYGKMEVSSISSNEISMKNDGSISLSSGNTVDIMGNVKFRVADSGELRFYPFVLVTEDMIMNKLMINASSNATAGDTISINVKAGGVPIEGVSIDIEPEIGPIGNSTNNNGTLDFTFPITSKGTYKITATKLGYQDANWAIEIEKANLKLGIDMPATADQFRTISIRVTYNNTTMKNATIVFDNDTIGNTDDNGTLNYRLESSGTHKITASKDGYVTVSREIDIRAPYSEFKAQDINIIPSKTFRNDNVLIISNITNVGTKSDTKSIELMVEDISVSNQSITIAPNEIKQINFTYKVSVPEGNYTVDILEQKALLEVKNAPLNIIFIGAIITVIGAIIIYGMTLKDKDILQKIRKYYK